MTTAGTDTETLFRKVIRVNSILKFNFRPIRHPSVGAAAAAAAAHRGTLYIAIIPSHFVPAAFSIEHTHAHDINSFVSS